MLFDTPADDAALLPAQVETVATLAGGQLDPCTDVSGRLRIEFLLGGRLSALSVDGLAASPCPRTMLGGTGEKRSFDQARAADSAAADEAQAEALLPAPPPVQAGSSKAWLVTYLDFTRDLVVTRGDPVAECVRLLPDGAVPRIRMIQRVL